MTDRLFLRQFCSKDGPSFYEHVMRDAGSPSLFGLETVTEADAVTYVSMREQFSTRHRFYDYVIVRREDQAVIGEINAAFIPPDTANVGYVIGSCFRGNGYASEALRLMLEKLAQEGIRIVYGACLADNHASEAVMRSCGMTPVTDVPDRVRAAESEADLKWFIKQNN